MTLNEGRGVNPGDTGKLRRVLDKQTSLNEGRGVNPGDTRLYALAVAPSCHAQRRPGREPRRHIARADFRNLLLNRSTKAGA